MIPARMGRETDVAVVIPSFNHGPFVGRAVQSALDQTLAPAEVIVIDDGSTDSTEEALRPFGSTIRVVRQENRGVASARNHGARIATAPLVAFLDADDAWHPKKLELQVARIVADPGLGLVNCGVEEVDEEYRTLRYRREGRGGGNARDLLRLREAAWRQGGS